MIWLIAKREILTRGRTKAFLGLTAILFFAVIGVAIASAVFGGSDEAREVTVGITGAGAEYGDLLEVGNDELAVTVVPNADRESVESGAVDVLFDGTSLLWDGTPDGDLDRYVRNQVQSQEFGQRAEDLELSQTDIGQLFSEVPIEELRLEGDGTDRVVRAVVAAGSGIATFILIQLWGAFVMMGVIEEKSSRVVEVLLSLVPARSLLAGKVLGLGILAIFQMLIFIGGVVLGLALVQDIEVPTGVWGTLPLAVVTFVLGFGFYASAFAAVGATVSRQEDASTAQLPAMLPLMIGYIIAIANVSTPDSLMVTIGSFVPFTAPVLLPFRTAFVDPPIWQIGLSLAILAVSIVLMLRLAGWVYRYSLLRTGSRVTYADAWKNRAADVID